MAVELRRCPACGRYSMGEQCPAGHGPTRAAHPPRYSPQDKWALYRRKEKYPRHFAQPPQKA
jgi:H/ACA ribonucleoprotein complex subunit 3